MSYVVSVSNFVIEFHIIIYKIYSIKLFTILRFPLDKDSSLAGLSPIQFEIYSKQLYVIPQLTRQLKLIEKEEEMTILQFYWQPMRILEIN